MKTHCIDIRIEVKNIKVIDRYYSYDYVVYINGVESEKGTYDNSHSWDDDKQTFRAMLRNGLAVQKIIDRLRIKGYGKINKK